MCSTTSAEAAISLYKKAKEGVQRRRVDFATLAEDSYAIEGPGCCVALSQIEPRARGFSTSTKCNPREHPFQLDFIPPLKTHSMCS